MKLKKCHRVHSQKLYPLLKLSSFWVYKPGHNNESPWGLTSASDVQNGYNFDQLPKDENTTPYKCKIMECSFRMSDYGIFDPKDSSINQVVETINRRYQRWVNKLFPLLQVKILKKKLQFYSV